MAKFTLSIETEEAQELRDIVNKIAGDAPKVEEPAAEKPKPQPAPKAEKPKPQPAPKAEAPAPAPQPEAKVEEAPAPAPAPVQEAAPVATETVTYEQIKQALITLMDKKSASVVQSLLKEKFGVPAISQLDKSRYGEAFAALTEWAA